MKVTPARSRYGSRLLLLIRHGKAAPKNVGLSDFERILTKKGAEECDNVARKISKQRFSIDFMLSSPADRALETAHLFARHFEFPINNIRIDCTLYTSDKVILTIARFKRLPRTVRTLVIVGHNPLCENLAAHLAQDFTGSIPKGAVVAISFGPGLWAKLKRGTGKLAFLTVPSAHGQSKGTVSARHVS